MVNIESLNPIAVFMFISLRSFQDILKCMRMIPVFKKFLSLSIRTFCSVVFSFQLYLLTQNYLQFNVRKEVTNYIANQIELPEIHILIPYQFAFDINFLKRKYKSSFESTCMYFTGKKDCNDYITNAVLFSKKFGPSLLLSDIAKHSYPIEKFISRLHWSESEEDPVEIGECRLKRRASAAYLVLVISCLDSTGSPIKVSRARAAVYSANYFLGFPLNATAC
uniref:Uncharacterized protein n=1 Tax=Tetranychus urticae TaxID=32264 RepID=T1L5Y3_TETUR